MLVARRTFCVPSRAFQKPSDLVLMVDVPGGSVYPCSNPCSLFVCDARYTFCITQLIHVVSSRAFQKPSGLELMIDVPGWVNASLN